jgi:sugar lactone lactonase YvrE
METCILFLRFNLVSAIRDFQRRALQVRRPRRIRLPGDRTRRLFRLEGLEDRCLLSGISAVTSFTAPSQGNGDSGITTGPDGNLWFTEPGASKIAMINPATDAITEFSVPVKNSGPYGITAGPDGNLWFTRSLDYIGDINPTTHAITEFGDSGQGASIITGPDGNLWFGEPASFVKAPWAIAAGPDGNLWFTQAKGPSSVSVVTTATNQVSVALANNPTGATLGGTLSVSASQGVATFSGLTINKVGNGYTLQVSSSGLSSVTTSAIDVTKKGDSIVLSPPAGTSAPDPLLGPLVLGSTDFLESLGLKKHAHSI